MSLFSKISLISIFLFMANSSWALNLTAIYTSACKRQLGLVVNVDDNFLQFLSIEGKILRLRPHEVIFLAHYPIDQLPIHREIDFTKVPALLVKTQEGTEIKTLVKGWPIGFTKDKISFLTTEGQETMIHRHNVFSLEYFPLRYVHFVKARSAHQFAFVHPHVFRECALENTSHKKNMKIYPQQVLSDPIMIKRELDHLRDGYNQVKRYHREQDFYPIAEVYKNATSLGLWQNFGSRYGSSSYRTNNLTPVLTDSYSSDIFDYQHIFITGSAPLMYALHEEPQTQIFYAFKSSYFHFSSMLDPSLMLVGRNYEWQANDFEREDDKLVSTFLLEMGFDFGNYSLDFYIANSQLVGILAQNELLVQAMNVPMFGGSYRSHNYKVQLLAGSGTYDAEKPLTEPQETIELNAFRGNLSLYYWKLFDITYSLIVRDLSSQHASFKYDGRTITHVGYVAYQLFQRYQVGGYMSYENHSANFGATSLNSEDTSNYLKAGGFVSLSF